MERHMVTLNLRWKRACIKVLDKIICSYSGLTLTYCLFANVMTRGKCPRPKHGKYEMPQCLNSKKSSFGATVNLWTLARYRLSLQCQVLDKTWKKKSSLLALSCLMSRHSFTAALSNTRMQDMLSERKWPHWPPISILLSSIYWGYLPISSIYQYCSLLC